MNSHASIENLRSAREVLASRRKERGLLDLARDETGLRLWRDRPAHWINALSAACSSSRLGVNPRQDPWINARASSLRCPSLRKSRSSLSRVAPRQHARRGGAREILSWRATSTGEVVGAASFRNQGIGLEDFQPRVGGALFCKSTGYSEYLAREASTPELGL